MVGCVCSGRGRGSTNAGRQTRIIRLIYCVWLGGGGEGTTMRG